MVSSETDNSVGGFLLRDEREFADVVILECALGIGRLIQIKCPCHMDLKWPASISRLS